MRKQIIRLGSLFAALAVALGAFGAHALKDMLPADALQTFETGVRYQFYHAFALLFIGMLLYVRRTRLMNYAAWCFVAGIVLFSGSLYGLALGKGMNISLGFLGPVTPLGGLCFLAGWIILLLSTFQDNEKRYRKDDQA